MNHARAIERVQWEGSRLPSITLPYIRPTLLELGRCDIVEDVSHTM